MAPVTRMRLPATGRRRWVGGAAWRDCRGGRHLGHDLCLPYGRWTGEEGRADASRRPRGGTRPTASSTPPSSRSGRAATRPPPSTPWPRVSACASSPSSTGSRPRRRCSRRLIDRSATELAEALEGSLARAGIGWARVEAVVRSVFRLAARRPELLGLLREVGRLGPPVGDPAHARARAARAAGVELSSRRRWTPGTCGATSPVCCSSPSTPRWSA